MGDELDASLRRHDPAALRARPPGTALEGPRVRAIGAIGARSSPMLAMRAVDMLMGVTPCRGTEEFPQVARNTWEEPWAELRARSDRVAGAQIGVPPTGVGEPVAGVSHRLERRVR